MTRNDRCDSVWPACHQLQMPGGQEEKHINSGVSNSSTVSFLGADTKLSLQEVPENKRIWPFLCKGRDWLAQRELGCLHLLSSTGAALTTCEDLYVLTGFYVQRSIPALPGQAGPVVYGYKPPSPSSTSFPVPLVRLGLQGKSC